ncbi:MAG: LPS export ABC transporter periplasmic protein LptC [Planctomycetota bacterium]|nr:LPS export ABC transporter periplasmic protein LptC [Planctomycetota bacterium]
MKWFAIVLFMVGVGALAYFLLESPAPQQDGVAGKPAIPSLPGREPTDPAAGRPTGPRMTIKDFSYPRYDGDEVRWEIAGKDADVLGEDRVKLAEPRIVFYPKQRAEKRELDQVFFSARRGDVEKEKDLALLYGEVEVTTSDGSKLTTDELRSNFDEKKIHTDKAVSISRSGMQIDGKRFDGHIQFEEFQIHEQVTVLIESAGKLQIEAPNRSDGAAKREPGLDFFSLGVTCDGPMTMENLREPVGPSKSWRVVFRQNVFISRETVAGESQLTADEVEAILKEIPAGTADGARSTVVIERMLAVGNARLVDPQFTASSQRMLFCSTSDQEEATFSGPQQTISFRSSRVFSIFDPHASSGARPGSESAATTAGGVVAAEPTVTTCTGPAVVKKQLTASASLPPQAVVATFAESVRARNERIDLMCDSLLVELRPSPKGGAAQPPDRGNKPSGEQDRREAGHDKGAERQGVPYDISLSRAIGNVLLVEDKLTAKTGELVWTPATGRADLYSENLSEVLDEKNRVVARRIRLLRSDNLVICQDEVDARFLVERGKGIEALFKTTGDAETPPDPAVRPIVSGPDGTAPGLVETEWRLKSNALQVRLRPEDNSFEALDASGNVSIDSDRMHATGTNFTYTHSNGKGKLVGAPMATVASGENVVTADVVDFSSRNKKIILRGKKRLSLAYELRDEEGFPTGKIERIEAVTLGDIVVFQEEGRFVFFDQAVITRPNSWVRSDRMTVFYDPKKENRLQHIFASGNVLVSDAQGLARADMLEWDFAADLLMVRAQPYACVAQKGKPMYGEIVTIDQNWTRIKSRNPKWGKGRILLPDTPKPPKK